MKYITDELLKQFENSGFTIDSEGYNNLITFTRTTSNNFEYEFSVYKGNNLYELEDNLFNEYSNFDVSYETYSLLDDEGHGKYSTIPYELEDVLMYIKEGEHFILDAYTVIRDYNNWGNNR